jgi:lipoprotein NlpI
VVAFDSAILSLQGRRHVSLAPLLAVAHYLRGTAHEAMGLPATALEDYDQALALAPDHEGALAARARLHARRSG